MPGCLREQFINSGKTQAAAHFQKIPVMQGFLLNTQQSPEEAMWLPSPPLNREGNDLEGLIDRW